MKKIKAKNVCPKMFARIYGKIDARKKYYLIFNDGTIRSSFTDHVLLNSVEYNVKINKKLVIETFQERTSLSKACEELLRFDTKKCQSADQERILKKRNDLINTILQLDSSINSKIDLAEQMISNANRKYNSLLTAYYSGFNSIESVDYSKIFKISLTMSPHQTLLNNWGEAKERKDSVIKIIKSEGEMQNEI